MEKRGDIMNYNGFLGEITKRFYRMSDSEKRHYLKLLRLILLIDEDEEIQDECVECPVTYYQDRKKKVIFYIK